MKTKINFLARLVALILFVTFIGCNEELYDIKDQHNGVDKNKITLSQFKNETNIGKVEPILSVPTKTSIASKSKSQLSDFVIDTLAVKKFISENNKTTYTFRIYPLSSAAQPNEIYNLVYRKVNNTWQTSIFYLKELPKENSELKLFEKIERIYGGKVTNDITAKTSSLEMCSFESTVVQCDGSCAREGYSQCDGFACPTGQCIRTSVTYMSCAGGSSGSSGSSDPGGYSGGGGGSSDPYSYSPNTYDNPVYDDPNYINAVKRSYVWYNLGDAAQGFFASNQENMNYFNQTIQYQIDNNWSPESKELADSLRKFKQDNSAVTWEEFDKLINYCNQNGNNPEIIEEAKNILDIIDDGKINGQQVVVGPDVAITNMTDYLKCFNTSQPATITIYADQPKKGAHSLISTTDGVGHAFISIKQGNNVATLGFYPKSSVNSIIPNNLTPDPTDFFPTPGVFGNDQGHKFDVSISVPINATELTNLINGFISTAAGNPVYNLGTSNCTDIAILAFESQADINIPSCESPNPLWNGQTPGTLGEVLRNMPTPYGGTKNTSGGSAPNNNCN